MSRAIRVIVTLRKKLNDGVLRKAIFVFLPSTSTPAQKNSLLDYLEEVIFHIVCLMKLIRLFKATRVFVDCLMFH